MDNQLRDQIAQSIRSYMPSNDYAYSVAQIIIEDFLTPKWISTSEKMPEYNVGVLVCIPDEDDHITSGMWDVSNKWVLLDEYRTVDGVSHWMLLPDKP